MSQTALGSTGQCFLPPNAPNVYTIYGESQSVSQISEYQPKERDDKYSQLHKQHKI